MSSSQPNPHNLLTHNAQYSILICTTCHYAIQKSALQSHLLRHKIYRSDRQRLLSSLAQLDILEPELVSLPPPGSTPIEHLPVLDGYGCTVEGCGVLCASSKRMQRHLREGHGRKEGGGIDEWARRVKMQTFFRGTKIRYFEVRDEAMVGVEDADPMVISSDENEEDEAEEEEGGGAERYGEGVPNDTNIPITMPPPPTTSSILPLDLQTLSDFHHFTTTTSLTLPLPQGTSPHLHDSSPHYWQTLIIPWALQRHWLMCSLLALSACHMASLTNEAVLQCAHRERAVRWFSEYKERWVDEGSNSGTLDVEIEKARKRTRSLLHLALCTFSPPMTSSLNNAALPKLARSPNLHTILVTIRSFTDVTTLEPSPTHFSKIIQSHYAPPTSPFLSALTTLPTRMTTAFGKPSPEVLPDVLATISAIVALVECCDSSYASSDPNMAWVALSTWLIKIPERFEDMVVRDDSAALVVLAHWVVGLVGRAESYGCWFLRGIAEGMMGMIRETLSSEDELVMRLVDDLSN